MKGRWIRRGLTALLAILLAIAPMAATAEESTLRHVVNCEHWISLREEPSVKAKRIMKIPQPHAAASGPNCSRPIARPRTDHAAGRP